MAIQWSAVSGRMRVGIDVFTDAIGPGTTTTTLYVDYYIRIENWRYADNQSLGMAVQDRWFAGVDFYNYQASNGTYEIFIQRLTFGGEAVNYGGGPTLQIGGSIGGAYDGSAPSLTINYTMPARPASVPDAAGVYVSGVSTNQAYMNISAPANNGAGIDAYEVQVSTNSGFTGIVATLGGSGWVTGLSPSSTYYVRSRAHNAIGWGAYGGTATFTTSAGVPSQVGTVTPSAVGQVSATLSWAAPANGGSAISGYEIQLATNSGFTAGVQNLSATASPYVATVQPGTQYWARVRAVNGVGAGAYSAAATFTTLAGTPVIISPAATAIRTSGIPSATVESLGITGSADIRVEWSKDNTFATGVTVVTKSVTGPTSDNRYLVENPAVIHSNGTWYVRARVTNNVTAYVTPWSATTTYSQTHTPSVTQVSPIANNVVGYAATTAFQWNFVDPAAPNDTQTYYQLIIENNATGAVVYDSGKAPLETTAANSLAAVDIAIAAAQKNVVLRWKVRVWDKADQVSAYSGYSLFRLSDPPTVTIIAPTAGINVTSGAPTFDWTTVVQSGGTQAGAHVDVYASATNQLVWSADVVGAATEVTPATVVFTNETDYYYNLIVTDTTGLSRTVAQTFHTSYVAPASITYAINSAQVDELGYIDVDWLAATPDSSFVSWRVYRRESIDNAWTLLDEIFDQNIRNYRDYWVNDGVTYLYSVTQTAMRSGVKLESAVGYWLSGASTVVEARNNFVLLSHYWLVHPTDPILSVRLVNVTSDTSTLEFEKATYNLIGRGRHADYGDELGYSGTITCQVRNGEIQSTFRKAMETLRRTQSEYYLRTPFGRLIMVSLGDISWTPLAGTGHIETGDLSFTYEQVAA